MASLTRNRCTDANKPTPATVRHYADRARDGAGFIVAEETFVYLNGTEWPHAPVMFDKSHVEAWRKITYGVHGAGDRILFQPWHSGEFLTVGICGDGGEMIDGPLDRSYSE